MAWQNLFFKKHLISVRGYKWKKKQNKTNKQTRTIAFRVNRNLFFREIYISVLFNLVKP